MVDVRCLVPVDIDTLVASVQKTGRVVIAHEAPVTGGFGAELAALIQERAFGYLHAPILRVAGHDVPYGFSVGDEFYRPTPARIRATIERALEILP